MWSSTATTSTNSSKVTAALYYKRTNEGYTTHGNRYCSITINGTKFSASGMIIITEGEWVKAAEGTVTVGHNADGTKSITISAEGYVSSTTLKSTTCSGNAALDRIPRASTITSAGNVILGTSCGVKWTPMAKSFRYKLKFSLGSWSHTTGAIHPNTTSAYMYSEYTIPLDVAKQLTSATSGTMTATLYTYSDSGATKQVGSASSKTFTVKIPGNEDTQPAVSMSLSPVSSLPSTFAGLYIQSKTKVKATLSADGKYGADIESYSMKVNVTSYGSGADYTSGYLSKYGSIRVYGYATDSRGFTGSTYKDITVIAYDKPKITVSVCGRCDADGNLSDSGTYLKIKATRSYSTVTSDGSQKNFCKIRYRYKAASADSYSSWATILASNNLSSDQVETGALLSGNLAVDTTYSVQVQAIDDIGEHAYTTISVPTDKVYWHRDGARRAFTFGGYVEEDNTFAIAEDIAFKVKGEKWVSLGLSTSVAESESNCGRGPSGTGCWYRVVNGNHVYVAFNCAFSYAGSYLIVNATAIPEEYRPAKNAYAMCATGGRSVARVMVNKSGYAGVDWIQVLSSAEATTESTVSWIDGYIDYFV